MTTATRSTATDPTTGTIGDEGGPGSEPVTLLILGASGDLAGRLLMPGLGGLLAHEPTRRVQLVGAGVEEYTDDAWHQRVTDSFASVEAHGPAVDALLESTRYVTADVTSADSLRELLEACDAPPAIYFALPPAITEKACEALKQLDLPEGTSLALEKPFGTDVASAEHLNRLVLELVPEDRVHRVDHFLGRATVLNLLGLRFANRLIEPMLNNQHVESIDIVYDETLGLEGRARYYDHAGALVDMIQSHLLQVMAVLTMNAPATLSAVDLRDEKQLVLRATRLLDGDPVANSRRARYSAGTIEGRDLPAYVDEEGVDASIETETLAEVVVEVQNWRWAGVPIRLRSSPSARRPTCPASSSAAARRTACASPSRRTRCRSSSTSTAPATRTTCRGRACTRSSGSATSRRTARCSPGSSTATPPSRCAATPPSRAGAS
jgi:glucose-6-phosphate 1-dehydrogenase